MNQQTIAALPYHQTYDFATEQTAPDWRDTRGQRRIEERRLHSGPSTRADVSLAGNGFGRLRVEMTVARGTGLMVSCGEPRAMLRSNVAEGYHEIVAHGGGTLACSYVEVPPRAGPHLVVFEFARGTLRIIIDGQIVLSFQHPTLDVMAHTLNLTFGNHCLVERVDISGAEPLRTPRYVYPPRANKPLQIEVAVDFMDDMKYAPYTASMFAQLFDEYKSWGVRRVHWMYKGGTRRGMWQDVHIGIGENFLRTVQHLGSEVFPHVVKLAKERGIEIYGLWKAFELAHMLCTAPPGSAAAREKGKVERVGGWIYWASEVVRRRRDLMMRRKPAASGPPGTAPITRIDLVKENAQPATFAAADLRLFVSDDNYTYRPYTGPLRVTEEVMDYPVWEHTPSGGRATGQARRCRVMRLDGLDVSSRFVTVAAPKTAFSFANTLVNLVHVFTGNREDRCLTYGLQQRVPKLEYDIATATRSRGTGCDFQEAGIEFDVLPGTPTACLAGYDAISHRQFLDGRDGVIAIARGKDPDPVGCMSPAYDETRAEWLDWVRDILEYGADGVDLRLRHHHSHLTWGEFGYEAPVREAFLARHGVDIWATDDFDRGALRRLRGEHYTQFYREAKRLITSYGKALRLHVSPTMDVEPELGGAMNMHFDWRKWIDEGLADGVTLKEIYPQTSLAEEILAHTRPRHIPVIFSPYANGIWGKGEGARITAERIALAQAGGCDGFQLYENCAVMRAHPDGRLVMEQPALRDVLRTASQA